MAAVTINIYGAPAYLETGIETVLSALRYTPFDIHVATHKEWMAAFPRSARITMHTLEKPSKTHPRSKRFMVQLNGLVLMLEAIKDHHVLHLDADTLLQNPIKEKNLHAALENHPMGMVEQTTVSGSDMNRARFLEHYTKVSLPALDEGRGAPDVETFRYFNAGVIIAERNTLLEFAGWAKKKFAAHRKPHDFDGQLVADQDYLQYWTHAVKPGCCKTLSWYWNHCEHWDEHFPRRDALILHFSNFALGPSADAAQRMREVRGSFSLLDRCFLMLNTLRWSLAGKHVSP